MSDQSDPPYVPPQGQDNSGYIIGWSVGIAIFVALFVYFVVLK